MTYDSRVDTYEHIRQVQALLLAFAADLQARALVHDVSKLSSPEKEVFDEFTPQLKDSTYGSPEYKGFLEAMGKGLKHHYAANSHHPEHYPRGIRGMTLGDLVEMFCDWVAATQRHADGNIRTSIDHNQKRFGYSDDIRDILHNTVDESDLRYVPIGFLGRIALDEISSRI